MKITKDNLKQLIKDYDEPEDEGWWARIKRRWNADFRTKQLLEFYKLHKDDAVDKFDGLAIQWQLHTILFKNVSSDKKENALAQDILAEKYKSLDELKAALPRKPWFSREKPWLASVREFANNPGNTSLTDNEFTRPLNGLVLAEITKPNDKKTSLIDSLRVKFTAIKSWWKPADALKAHTLLTKAVFDLLPINEDDALATRELDGGLADEAITIGIHGAKIYDIKCQEEAEEQQREAARLEAARREAIMARQRETARLEVARLEEIAVQQREAARVAENERLARREATASSPPTVISTVIDPSMVSFKEGVAVNFHGEESPEQKKLREFVSALLNKTFWIQGNTSIIKALYRNKEEMGIKVSYKELSKKYEDRGVAIIVLDALLKDYDIHTLKAPEPQDVISSIMAVGGRLTSQSTTEQSPEFMGALRATQQKILDGQGVALDLIMAFLALCDLPKSLIIAAKGVETSEGKSLGAPPAAAFDDLLATFNEGTGKAQAVVTEAAGKFKNSVVGITDSMKDWMSNNRYMPVSSTMK